MKKGNFSVPLSVRDVQVTDAFWKKEMELIRTEVVPYQWEALNDRIADAAPSFCMHNFKTAAKQNREKKEQGKNYSEPVYTFRGFEALPENPLHLEDKFYGFVFQDSDFYKWIEAVGYCLAWAPDPELERIADEAIEIVCAAQQEDGYLDTYYILNGKDKIFTNLRNHHELYCLGHLLEGAIAYYQATGKRKLLDTACRFADYVASYFGKEEGKCKGYPGHEIAEMALLRLYELTGEEKYRKLGCFFLDERGKRPYYFDCEEEAQKEKRKDADALRYQYYQAHLPVREQQEAVGHAVRAVYLYSGMTDAARITGDESLYEACERIWKDVVEKKLYITGGIGATRHGEAFSYAYNLPNDTVYAETCASIGLVFWARRMLEIYPDAKYADVMEQALYNCVLSGMALDGKSFFYVNPLEVEPQGCHEDEDRSHVKPVRQKWFGCACCPPNLARLISSVSTYAYTEREDTLFVHLYMGSTVTKALGSSKGAGCGNGAAGPGNEKAVCGEDAGYRSAVTVRVESGFPWNGGVTVSVEVPEELKERADEAFTLALRIPGWAGSEEQEAFSLRGAEHLKQRLQDGYLYLSGDWSRTGTLELTFPMEIKIWQADTRVRRDLGRVAVTRGPIVYCMEEADNGGNLHLITLDCEAAGRTEDFTICGEKVKSLLMQGYRRKPVTGKGLYYPAEKAHKEPVQLRLIPYYTWANRGENEMMVWVWKE